MLIQSSLMPRPQHRRLPPAGSGLESIMSDRCRTCFLVFIAFYFLMLRPQQQRAKQKAASRLRLAQSKSGDTVTTAGGIVRARSRKRRGTVRRGRDRRERSGAGGQGNADRRRHGDNRACGERLERARRYARFPALEGPVDHCALLAVLMRAGRSRAFMPGKHDCNRWPGCDPAPADQPMDWTSPAAATCCSRPKPRTSPRSSIEADARDQVADGDAARAPRGFRRRRHFDPRASGMSFMVRDPSVRSICRTRQALLNQ